MRVKLVGDHSGLHSGCQAVVKTIKDSYPSATFVDGEEYDALIVNGEGSMHHSSGGWHKKMIQIGKGISYGVPTYLVNSVWQENSDTYNHLLPKLRGIWVREFFSFDELIFQHNIPLSSVSVAPDLSLWCDLKHDPKDVTPYTGIVCTEDYWNKEDMAWAPMPCSHTRIDMQKPWGALVESLKTAECLITGRHHAIYAAILAGIPFIPIEGNTWKNAGVCFYTQNVQYYQDAHDLDKRVEQALSPNHIVAYKELSEFFSVIRQGPKPLPDLLSL